VLARLGGLRKGLKTVDQRDVSQLSTGLHITGYCRTRNTPKYLVQALLGGHRP